MSGSVSLWPPDNPVGTSSLDPASVLTPQPPVYQQSLSMPSPDFSPIVGWYGQHPVTQATREQAAHLAGNMAQFSPADVGAIMGPGSAIANLRLLDRAKIMEAKGAPALDIHHETAWFRSPNKEWQFETPADHMTPTWLPGQNRPFAQGNMGHLVRYPDVYAGYPDIRQMPVKFDPSFKSSWEASYVPALQQFEFSPYRAPAGKVFAHEVQHAISDLEGWQRGGNPMWALTKQSLRPELNKSINQQAIDTYGLKSWQDFANAARQPMSAVKQPYADYLNASYAAIPPGDMQSMITRAAHDVYHRMGGEVLSRLVEDRLGKSAAYRQANPPFMAYDVPPEQQIFRPR